MSIERAERLKRELTDKWVVVAEGTPELRRFANLTGKVRTVNMNCRALVEFDGPVDIGWYDIDPNFLTVVDSPRPKKQPEAHAEKAKPAAAAAKPVAKPAAGGSPLDKIRAAGSGAAPAPAAGSPLDKIRAAAGGAKPAAAAGAASGGSPMDKIRAAAAKPAVEPAAEAPAPEAAAKPKAPPTPAPAPTGSPLDQIRAMGAVKKQDG